MCFLKTMCSLLLTLPVYSGAMRFSWTFYFLLFTVPGGFTATGFGLVPPAVAAQAVEVDRRHVHCRNRAGRATNRYRDVSDSPVRVFGDNARTIAQGTLEIVLDAV